MIVHPCGKNKDTDQLCSYCTADLRLCFCICKSLVFSCEGSVSLPEKKIYPIGQPVNYLILTLLPTLYLACHNASPYLYFDYFLYRYHYKSQHHLFVFYSHYKATQIYKFSVVQTSRLHDVCPFFVLGYPVCLSANTFVSKNLDFLQL